MAYQILIYIAILLVSAYVQQALTPKIKPPKPASLKDVDATTAEEGRPIPVVFGEVWLRSPNLLWYGDLSSTAIKKKGGKK